MRCAPIIPENLRNHPVFVPRKNTCDENIFEFISTNSEAL